MKVFNKILEAEFEEKFFKRIVLISIIIVLSIILIAFLNLGMMRNYSIPSEAKTKNKDEIEFRVDSILTGRKYIEITGWAYKKGQSVGYFDNRFIIKNEETKKYKALSTEMRSKDEFFSIDKKYDCRRSGMYSKVLALGLPKGLYQIFIEYKSDNENVVFDTGIMFNYEG